MTVFESILARTREVPVWPDRREIPCKDLDLDCFAFDGIIPFGDYRRCHAYEPEAGRCIFCATDRSNSGG
jgi:hypothetical protein